MVERTLTEWQQAVHKTAVERGWRADGRELFCEKLALMHSELSEALEDFRSGHGLDMIYYTGDKPGGIPIELADCVIRIMDFCEANGIDLNSAIEIKSRYNETRPYRHGNKAV